MKIETKYNNEDIPWVMFLNKPEQILIKDIIVEKKYYGAGDYRINITYTAWNKGLQEWKESELFSTKEDLIKSL